MKSLQEYIIDNQLKSYLSNELDLHFDCRCSRQPFTFGICERLGNFINCDKVLDKILDELNKIKEEDVDNYKDEEIKIDVKDCEAYCKAVKIILNFSEDDSTGGFLNVTKNGEVTIHLDLHYTFKIYSPEVEGLILHELIHGYEEYNRLINNKRSILDELSYEYYNSIGNLSNKSDDVRNIAVLKYFFNPKEMNANFGTLEKTIKRLLEKYDPNKWGVHAKKIKDELKKDNVWKRYFEFNKFMLTLNNYSDKQLEDTYYEVVTDINKKSKDLRTHIDKIKKGEKDDSFKKVKSAGEIRKEIKKVWRKFINKFNQLFAKIYCEHVLSYKGFRTTSYELSGK